MARMRDDSYRLSGGGRRKMLAVGAGRKNLGGSSPRKARAKNGLGGEGQQPVASPAPRDEPVQGQNFVRR